MKHSVAGIAIVDNLVLVARRLPTGAMGGRWEFPGGKVDGDECYQEALMREYKEEFSVSVTVGTAITNATFTNAKGESVALHAFEVNFPKDSFEWVLTEHTEVKWVKLSEIKKMYFVDSDLLLLDEVINWAKKKGVYA